MLANRYVIVANQSREKVDTRGKQGVRGYVRGYCRTREMFRNLNSKLQNLFVRGRNLSARDRIAGDTVYIHVAQFRWEVISL